MPKKVMTQRKYERFEETIKKYGEKLEATDSETEQKRLNDRLGFLYEGRASLEGREFALHPNNKDGSEMKQACLSDLAEAIGHYKAAGATKDLKRLKDRFGEDNYEECEKKAKEGLGDIVGNAAEGLLKALGLGGETTKVILFGLILGGGLYYLFPKISVVGSAVTNIEGINPGFLINFIIICLLGLVVYSYFEK